MPRAPAKAPRRQAKQERARQTIAVVLEAAAQVLRREGYARATTNRIAERAGVSVGTVYQYFEDKDQIFDELIRQEVERLVALLHEVALDPGESIPDWLRRLLQLLVAARPDAPGLYRSLEQVPNGLFRRRVDEVRDRVIGRVRDLLADRRGEICVADLDIAAFMLVAAAEGVAVNASAEFYRARCADELALVFTRYLTGSGA